MATELRRTYGSVDEELFDVDRIPTGPGESRSVGEMLFDIDQSARQLLMDVVGDDAGPLLRSWPLLVAAAEDLWAALPARRPGADEHDRPIARLAAQAATIHDSVTSKAWPGEGPTNRHLDRMARTLLTAAVLVRRYRTEIPRERPDTRRDLQAARARVMHGLYLTAHAVVVALHAHGRDRVTDAGGSGRPVELATRRSPYAIAPTGVWIDRMTACENTARTYLTGRLPHTLDGEATPPLHDPGRLARALARFDIGAHRALAGDFAPSNVVLVTRTQGLIAGASMLLIDAATTAGVLEPSDRLIPGISDAGRCWNNLASRWGDLVPPGARVEEQLAHAAAEVRAAYRHLTHDTTTLATPELIATRPGLTEAVAATLHAIESSPELADVIAEKAHTPNLTGPARTLSRRAHNDVESGLASPPPEGDVIWVSPADILAKREVALPPPVLETLHAASDLTIDATTVASTLATLHTPVATPPATTTPRAPSRSATSIRTAPPRPGSPTPPP